MNAHEEAAAIFNHYFQQLAWRAGAGWSDRNRADIDRAAQLLAGDEPADIIPPYQPAPELLAEPACQIGSAVTQVLEREPAKRQPASAHDLGDPNFLRWRQQRQRQAEDDQTRRLVQREQR